MDAISAMWDNRCMSHASVDPAKLPNLLGAAVVALGDELSVSADDAAIVSLRWHDGISIDALAAIVGLSQPGTVRLVDRLERAGMVRRGPGPDGRTRALHVSAKGRRRAGAVLATRDAVLGRVLASLTPHDAERLEVVLSDILGHLAVDDAAASRICRLCDEDACGASVDCPVDRALEPAP